MVNVVVSRKRNINITTNATAGVIDTTVPVTLKNVPTLGGAATVGQLNDVNSSNLVDGATLVYDQITQTYIVQRLDFVDLNGDLDGGLF